MNIDLDNLTYNEKKNMQHSLFNYIDNFYSNYEEFPNFRKISQRFKIPYSTIEYLLEDMDCITFNNKNTKGNITVEIIY